MWINSLIILGIFLPSIASGCVSNLKPYLGTSIGIKDLNFKANYGSTLFNNTQRSGNVVFGVELSPYLDLELNLEKTIAKNKKKTMVADEGRELGIIMPTELPGGFYNFDSRISYSSVGINLFYKFRISGYRKLIPMLGVGLNNFKITLSSYITDTTRPQPGRGTNLELINNNNKVAIKLIGGLEYIVNDHLSGRLLLNCENTAGLAASDNDGRTARLRNSLGVTIGMILRI